PSGHYLVPSLGASGLAVGALLLVADRAARAVGPWRFVRFAAAGALLAGFVFATTQDLDYVRTVSSYAEDVARMERQLDAPSARFIEYYGSPRVVYALSFGNEFARKRYGPTLGKLYPDALFYSIWDRRF